jgi:hypothetical protein
MHKSWFLGVGVSLRPAHLAFTHDYMQSLKPTPLSRPSSNELE